VTTLHAHRGADGEFEARGEPAGNASAIRKGYAGASANPS